MKVFIFLFAVAVSCASAGHLGGYGGHGHGYNHAAPAYTGSSTQFRSEDNYGNYQFGYDESHAYGSTGRREERYGDVVRGSYNLGEADGRQRTVNYVADGAGFRATIQTNEPGVDAARDPAAVLINKEANHAVAPVVHAPVVAHAPVAPVAAYRAPAPLAIKSYAAPAPAYVAPAPVYGAHAAHAGYAAAGPAYAPTPRAFSYSFGASHPGYSTGYAAAPLAPLATPAAVYHDEPVAY